MIAPFHDTYGFNREDVTLANWRLAPYSRWSFQNLRELVPTSGIRCRSETREQAAPVSALMKETFHTSNNQNASVLGFLDFSHTDAFVLMRHGEVIAEHYAPHTGVNARHVIFSVSKSLTGILCGILEDEGVLDPDKPVTHYVPEAATSAYGDCTLRHVLDMRVSLDFTEDYLNTDGDYARYRRSTLWNPHVDGKPDETMAEVLFSLPKAAGPHGGAFFYASPNSDMLGVIIERATGRRYAELMSEYLWQAIGAHNHASISVDRVGAARSAGGISVTARDLARIGTMLLSDGTVSGKQVVSERWIADMLTAGDHEAWVADNSGPMPKGRYRSQWYQTGEEDNGFCAIGIHGQWLYIDPRAGTVIVKFSSQPDPLDDDLKQDNLAFFRSVNRLVS